MTRPLFYLGTHHPDWLWKAAFPLFVSHARLAPVRRLKNATCAWALDSGGFTQLQREGRWTITPAAYVAAVRRYRDQIGGLAWAAPQDWMCEPAIIQGGRYGGQTFVGTGLSVREHQERTVANYLELTSLAPDLPFIPVVQGFTLPQYKTCLALYETAGVDLTRAPLVGLGSVCRRQSTAQIHHIVSTLAGRGLRLHGFGVKTGGLQSYGRRLASADSMAWSYNARRRPPLPGHTHSNCANCRIYAARWRERLLLSLTAGYHQTDLYDLGATTSRRAV
jgi:hypothetical protein